MFIISAKWGELDSFRMIPSHIDCPYSECIYDASQGILAIISKEKRQKYHFLPKLDDRGKVIPVKRKAGDPEEFTPFAEERRLMESSYEYYIENADEILDFIQNMHDNTQKVHSDYESLIKK
jgi:hypothetical protein